MLIQHALNTEESISAAFSEDQARKIYIAERMLFYVITRGFGYKQSDLERIARGEAMASYEKFRKSKRGFILGKTKPIRHLRREMGIMAS